MNPAEEIVPQNCAPLEALVSTADQSYSYTLTSRDNTPISSRSSTRPRTAGPRSKNPVLNSRSGGSNFSSLNSSPRCSPSPSYYNSQRALSVVLNREAPLYTQRSLNSSPVSATSPGRFSKIAVSTSSSSNLTRPYSPVRFTSMYQSGLKFSGTDFEEEETDRNDKKKENVLTTGRIKMRARPHSASAKRTIEVWIFHM